MPIVLVGTKTDLRRDKHTLDMLKAQGLRPITPQQAQVVADKIGARCVLRVSCVSLRWSVSRRGRCSDARRHVSSRPPRYAECSARNNDGVDNVFNIAMTLALRRRTGASAARKKKRGDCTIL